MTRVVHVVVAGEFGGAERMMVDLASHPDETGAEHAVALLTSSEPLRRLLLGSDIRVHDGGPLREGPWPFLRRSFAGKDVAWMTDVLREESAEVAHLHTFGSQVLGTRAALRWGARVLRTEHSTRVFDDLTCWPFSRWSLSQADASVAVSQHVRAVAIARAPWAATKMSVVANGVDTDHFSAQGGARQSAFTLVLVGRLEPRKGVDLAIEALVGIPSVRLEVVGDGEERSALEAQARSLGVGDRVSFHGHVDDTRPILEKGDAALCASRAEGLGIALLEAMAMGLPVVGFAVGGVPEIVTHGETGLLCAPDGVAPLRATLLEAIASRARLSAMGEGARRRVVARFSVKAMCAGYADVYRELGSPSSSEAGRDRG